MYINVYIHNYSYNTIGGWSVKSVKEIPNCPKASLRAVFPEGHTDVPVRRRRIIAASVLLQDIGNEHFHFCTCRGRVGWDWRAGALSLRFLDLGWVLALSSSISKAPDAAPTPASSLARFCFVLVGQSPSLVRKMFHPMAEPGLQ